jgi:integral membrane protein
MTPRAKLTFFRVMAFLVGVFLLVLAAHMILHYGFGNDVLAWWPAPHGWFYMVYIVATALLGFELGWGLGKMVLVMLAGCVPFLSFWVEHRVSRAAAAQIEAGSAPAVRVGA